MAAPNTCTNCQAKPPKARGLCGTCHEYQRRHGQPRPPHLTARQYELNRTNLDTQIEKEILDRNRPICSTYIRIQTNTQAPQEPKTPWKPTTP